MFDAARRAQAEIQHYLTAEGESEFVSVGKAGPVELMARPPPVGEKFQVMMGRRSFGRREIDLSKLLDTLMDPTALSKYNSHASDGRILRKGLIDEPERRLDLQYATFKGTGSGSMSIGMCSKTDCPYQDPQPGLVRCEFLCYGYAIMRDPQTGELSVTMFSQADPGGNVRNIPTWIANKGQRAQPASLNHLYNLLKADQRYFQSAAMREPCVVVVAADHSKSAEVVVAAIAWYEFFFPKYSK
ncbi:hypothetical protein Pmar_PMAR017333 [Perkinsus marinus ATCC 50983]|uniref:START domain-containing protein n=1 Tax=Perkinsus marinus (strain ATCC 50983 / TXsc) TaxID=423536 RepID=C5LHB0_PERM5|nr:hypothetical protein Pmar_PMAR017333 [Perkinsus marinus ATCC 50983]EER03919.1 hypothetical protein Pmar_PMAR017333 [Perkinsus marinus ATCC 50983]|eukprot:XP_002772103.1 hypothetical protein Pmar_PMAR017333 [Perkinsus marinus ATCC 50983]